MAAGQPFPEQRQPVVNPLLTLLENISIQYMPVIQVAAVVNRLVLLLMSRAYFILVVPQIIQSVSALIMTLCHK